MPAYGPQFKEQIVKKMMPPHNQSVAQISRDTDVALPIIGHLKVDNRMNRCHIKGSNGDSLQAVLCAAGFNFLWLLRMIGKKGIGLCLRLLQASGVGHSGHQLRELFIYKSVTPDSRRLALT